MQISIMGTVLQSPISILALSHMSARSRVGLAMPIPDSSTNRTATGNSDHRNFMVATFTMEGIPTIMGMIMGTPTKVQGHRWHLVVMSVDFRNCLAIKVLFVINLRQKCWFPCRATANH
jgi:hypothetical protein